MTKNFKTFLGIIVFALMNLGSFSAYCQQNSGQQDLFVSYYSDWFVGRHTSNGEIYKKGLFTAAHPTLPFGTKLKITNPKNNKSIIVKVNDRCAWVYGGKRFDLSYVSAKSLDMLKAGVIWVKVEILPEDAIVGVVPNTSNICPPIQLQPTESTLVNNIVITSITPPKNTEANNNLSTVNEGDNFGVQVGAFSMKNYAENIVKTLKNRGFRKITIAKDEENPQAKYRVVVSKGSNYDRAWEVAQRLQKMKFDYYIVRL